MPRYTLSTVIQKALYGALEDRAGLLDAYHGHNDEVEQEIASIEALRGLKFDKMTPEQKEAEAARLALVFAEQWDAGVAESQGKGTFYGKKAAKDAAMFRTYRLQYFGITRFEEFMANSKTIILGATGWVWEKTGLPYEPPQ